MLLLTLRGTPTIYYGEEIGMHDVKIPPDRIMDPRERNCPGLGLGRDPQRTPMQWSGKPCAGFTQGEPWLPLAEDFQTCNVDHLQKDPQSNLCLYKRLIEVRQSEPALAVGTYAPIDLPPPLFGFLRQHGKQSFATILNLSNEPQMYQPNRTLETGNPVLSTLDPYMHHRPVEGGFRLQANEGMLIKLEEVPEDAPVHIKGAGGMDL